MKATTKKNLFNIYCITASIFFAYLGFWQIERMHWKQGLIEQTEKYKAAAPVKFKFGNYDAKKNLFERVYLKGRFLHKNEILLSAKYRNAEQDKNELGYHIITPFITDEGIIVFVNRGWIPQEMKEKIARPDSLAGGSWTTVEGIMRENQGQAPWYMPQNMREKNVWFWIDLPEMIKMLEDTTQLRNIKPVLIQQINRTTRNDFAYPEPLNADIEFYNQHLVYIITWFALSLVTIGMWVIYLRKNKNGQK